MTALAEPIPVTTPSFRRHVAQTLRLAGPVVVARSGVLVMMAVDTAMTGHAGQQELAWFGLGLSPTIALTLLGLGFLLGVSVLSSQAMGAGEPRAAGHAWRTGMVYAVGIGLVFLGICQAGGMFLSAIGHAPDLADGGGEVMHMLGYGMPGVMIFVACSFYLEGTGRPAPGMIIMLGANVLNFGLNWVMIYGNPVLGLDLVAPMGAAGAALATTLTRWVTAVVAVLYVLFVASPGHFGVRSREAALPDAARRMRRIGVPMGLTMFIEVAALMTMTQLAGLLGRTEVAGYQIAHNLLALAFMSAIGLGAATSIRVGNAVGRRDRPGVVMAGLVGVGICALVMAFLGGLFLTIPGTLIGFYTSDPAVIAQAAAALTVAGCMMVADGPQAVLANALRSLGDVWGPLLAQLAAFWALAIPVSWVLAFRLDYGTAGLMGGVAAGCVASVLINGARFMVVSRRPLRRS
ncbi:MAG: MATE family efflux transporter [Pseudomonadota bacterium]|nr:MATE family efflux transporter [Pseudomonadota bacterium]